MKFVREHFPGGKHSRGYNNWKSADGRFHIRNSGYSGSNNARWIITTTDGSKPFKGWRGKPTDVTNAPTIADAKEKCIRAAERESA